ncbi:MAG TPA: hypothetical protein VHG08_23695 [Longimicrobium sp.]|nr:hypothetical protein [Longimicrobium sp.]
MSVFSFPRINVKGLIQVNVGTANNDDYSNVVFPPGSPNAGQPLRLANSMLVQPVTYGMTDDEWVAWVQQPHPFAPAPGSAAAKVRSRASGSGSAEAVDGTQTPEEYVNKAEAPVPLTPALKNYLPAEWNYYGNMGLTMQNVQVVGVDAGGGTTDPALQGLVGATLAFGPEPGTSGPPTGLLIDVNPEDVPSSQVIAAKLVLTQNGQTVMQGPPSKAVTRWVNFQRNARLPGPNGAAGTFQCTIPVSALQGQPILQLLPQQGPAGQALAGVVFRYTLARALQPVNYYNHPDNDAWIAAMMQVYAGKGLNPDYCELAGTIAPWWEGEMQSTPTGRLLQTTSASIPVPPATPPEVIGNSPPFSLAPAVLVVDESAQRVSVDFATTFPECYQGSPAYDPLVTGNNPKWDFGAVNLQVRGEGGAQYDFGPVPYADTAAGDACGWVFDFALPPEQAELARTGTFYLNSAQYGDLLAEQEYLIASDQACIFAEQGGAGSTTQSFTNDGTADGPATIRVFQKGVELAPAECPAITVWEYDTTPINDPGSVVQRATDYGPGQPLTADVSAPGNRLFTFTLPGQDPPPASYKNFSVTTSPMINLRILPNEDYSQYFVDPAADPPTGNASLTWDVLYDTVFRNYYLLYPAMSKIVPLNQESAWNTPAQAQTLMERVARSAWPTLQYMPRTRDLSASRRRLVQGWCNAVINAGGSSNSSST